MNRNRNQRGRLVTGLSILATLAGCMGEAPAASVVGDWGDDNLYPEAGGAYASLTMFAGVCAFTPSSGVMAVTTQPRRAVISPAAIRFSRSGRSQYFRLDLNTGRR